MKRRMANAVTTPVGKPNNEPSVARFFLVVIESKYRIRDLAKTQTWR
jgi:hypothetical protein